MPRQIQFQAIPLSLFAFVFSCGIQDEPTRQNLQQQATGAERLIIVGGNSQSATVTTKLSDLVVAAIDGSGNPLIGAKVEFGVESGPVRLGASEIQTDLDGKATVSAELTTVAGAAKVKARLLPDPNNDENRTVFFDVMAVRDAPTTLSPVTAATCTSVDKESKWVVKLSDKYNNGVSGLLLKVTPENGLILNGDTKSVDLQTDGGGKISFIVRAPANAGATPPAVGDILVEAPVGTNVPPSKTTVQTWPTLRFLSLDAVLPTSQPDNQTAFMPTLQLLFEGCTAVPNQDIRYRVGYYSTCPTNPIDILPSAQYGTQATTDANGRYTGPSFGNVNYQSGAPNLCYYYRADYSAAVAFYTLFTPITP